MLKMEYFNFRLLLGVLRSKKISGRRWHHSVYSVNEHHNLIVYRTGNRLTPGGRHAPGYPIHGGFVLK